MDRETKLVLALVIGGGIALAIALSMVAGQKPPPPPLTTILTINGNPSTIPSGGVVVTVPIILTGTLSSNVSGGGPIGGASITIWEGLSTNASELPPTPAATVTTDSNGAWTATINVTTAAGNVVGILAGYKANAPTDPAGVFSNFLYISTT